MTIRFVYFDLGNILFSFVRDRAAANIATLLNVDAGDADVVLHDQGLQEELEHGRYSGVEYAQLVCDRLHRSDWMTNQSAPSVAAAKIGDAISDMFTPISEMAGVVADTKKTIGRIGILSNTCEAHWDWIRRMRSPILDQPIDEIVLSCRVESMKPDEKIYRVAQAQAGCQPSEILFVDDKEENVVAAQNLGWNAEVCLGGTSAIEVLSRYDAIGDPHLFKPSSENAG